MKGKGRHLIVSLSLPLAVTLGVLWLLGSPRPRPAVVRAAAGDVYCVTAGGGTFAACTQVFTHPQAAVDAATGGEEIRIAAGTYTGVQNVPSLTTDEITATQLLVITKSLTIRGGYTTADWTTADPAGNRTTLDAQGEGRVLFIVGDPSAGLGQAITPTVEGLHITGGDATGLGGSYWGQDGGGGVHIWEAAPTIRGCLIADNVASRANWGAGGGLFAMYGAATLAGNSVVSNTASTAGQGSGGGLTLRGGKPIVSGNTVMSNRASAASTGYGGGVCLRFGEPSLRGNTVVSNVASIAGPGRGGGLYIRRSLAGVHGNTVSENVASTSDGGSGGGLYLEYSAAAVTGNIVHHNVASTGPWNGGFGYGGGIHANSSDGITLMHNELRRNLAHTTARGYGGGAYLSSSRAAVMGNAIIRNVASGNARGEGGGLVFRDAPGSVLNNLILGNTATLRPDRPGLGGGLVIEQSTTFTLANNLVADNHANTEGSGIWIGGTYAPTSGRLLHTTVADNVGGSGHGVYVGSDASVALTNTIVSGHPSVGITLTMGSTATLEATLWHNNGSDTGGAGAISSGTVNVYGAPAFVDPAAGNYHLTVASAAIDEGVPAGVTTDIDGNERPQEAGYDIGADEYVVPFTVYLPVVLRSSGRVLRGAPRR